MEPNPNARVLPSNAPALLGNANGLLSPPTGLAETLSSETCQRYNVVNDCSTDALAHVCLRCKQHGQPATDCQCGILRTSSGNAGSSVFQSRNTDVKTRNTQKYGYRPVSSLVNPPHHSAQAAIRADYPRRQQNSSWSSPKTLPMYWHVEWQTPRYQTYREKIRQKGTKDEKWSDRVEEAFQKAIRIFRRRGRKKSDLHGKQSGGNEFIADYIKKTTGEKRDRKQVSSHIQVLKGFLHENKAWMSLVADIKPETSNRKAHGSTAHEEMAGGFEDLDDDDASAYQHSQASCHPLSHRPSASIEILASNVYPGPTIRRVEFSMALQDKESSVRHHIYTSIQSEMASAPKTLEDVNGWRNMYPPLADYFDRGQIGCPIFLFDTTLSMMDRYCPSNTNRDSTTNLAIRFSMDFSQGAFFTDWRSYPRVYEQNGCLVDFAALDQLDADTKPSDPLHIEHVSPVKGTDDCTLGKIGFRSKWWVQVFSRIMNEKRWVERNGDPKLIREEEERAIQYVEGLSVMQEIWATHRDYKHRPQRMAILLWKFSTARRGEAATTSWRRLLPPLSPYEIQSPHPAAEKPPMTLDTTLQAASPFTTHYTTQPSIFSEYPTGDLVTAPLAGDGSTLTTPTPESRSFPSATSTSFPSSVSNSTYPLYPSQEASFHSQDSAYPALNSFDPQDPGYSLYEHHEIVAASHESYGRHEFADGSQESYGSQEVIYHSQGSLYQHPPDQLYEYPYGFVDAPIAASTSQDFTGGQIHLSYAQTGDSQSSYEAPLIAPQANMVPQHQLIQHPEHFDQHDYLEQNPEDVNGDHEEVDEQGHTESLPQPYELNGVTFDYDVWEETLRLNPDLERHLSGNAVDEVRDIGRRFKSPVGQQPLESTPGTVLGEVEDEEGKPDDRQLEYQ